MPNWQQFSEFQEIRRWSILPTPFESLLTFVEYRPPLLLGYGPVHVWEMDRDIMYVTLNVCNMDSFPKYGHQSIFQNYEWSIFRNSDIRPSRICFKKMYFGKFYTFRSSKSDLSRGHVGWIPLTRQ